MMSNGDKFRFFEIPTNYVNYQLPSEKRNQLDICLSDGANCFLNTRINPYRAVDLPLRGLYYLCYRKLAWFAIPSRENVFQFHSGDKVCGRLFFTSRFVFNDSWRTKVERRFGPVVYTNRLSISALGNAIRIQINVVKIYVSTYPTCTHGAMHGKFRCIALGIFRKIWQFPMKTEIKMPFHYSVNDGFHLFEKLCTHK